MLDPAYTNILNVTADAGTVVSTSVNVECGTRYSFIVEAVDILEISSEPSNEVHLLYSCIYQSNGLSAGAIAGIVIGCIFLIILILFIIYAICNRGHFKESKVGSALICQCCKKEAQDNKNNHLVSSRTGNDHDVIRRNPTPRDLNDNGYVHSSRPTIPARRIADVIPQKGQHRPNDSDSDIVIQNNQMQQNVRMSDLGDDSSDASSHSGANPRYNPKNRVGIPLATSPSEFNRVMPPVPPRNQNQVGYVPQDNFGYQDSESGAYSVSNQTGYTKKPILPPLQRRNNTQV